MKVFGADNETKNRAKAKKLATGYLDAKPDVVAAIEYANELFVQGPIILFGSSYSAALALLIVSTSIAEVTACILCSPGEYLKSISLATSIRNISIPIFTTSSKAEHEAVTKLLDPIDNNLVTHFKTTEEGFHGSKILWKSVKGYEQQWHALTEFLEQL